MPTLPREKSFNTAGPCEADLHYILPPTARFDMDEIMNLIRDRRYFVLHAPRQTGKTTALLALMHQLNAEGEFRALYANIERAQAAREKVDEALPAIAEAIASHAERWLGDTQVQSIAREVVKNTSPNSILNQFLFRWCQSSPKATVLMLDEVDALVGDTLISVLRQIRAGYANRPSHFPQTIILCGVRDVRDYRIAAGGGSRPGAGIWCWRRCAPVGVGGRGASAMTETEWFACTDPKALAAVVRGKVHPIRFREMALQWINVSWRRRWPDRTHLFQQFVGWLRGEAGHPRMAPAITRPDRSEVTRMMSATPTASATSVAANITGGTTSPGKTY